MHLTTSIAGIPHRKPNLAAVLVGDEVTLVPEPDNAFDPAAIKVMHNDNHLGYIPRTETSMFQPPYFPLYVIDVQPSRKWKEVYISTQAPEPIIAD